MAKNGLLPAEVAFIAEYMQQGMIRDEDESQLEARREWIASRFEISVAYIRGICAKMRQKLEGVIRDRLSADEIRFAKAYVEGLKGKDRADAQEDLAVELAVPLSLIQVLTDGTRYEVGSALSAYSDPSTLLPGGEHFDYNTPTKAKLRAGWESFQERLDFLSDRSDKKVACFPGKMCLELPVYKRLGYASRNIIGIEGGDRLACAQYEINVQPHEIDPRVGRAEHILPKETVPLDVASFDFGGPICDLYMEDILPHTLLAEDAAVLMVVAGKREKRRMIEALKRLRMESNGTIDDVLATKGWGNQLKRMREMYVAPTVPPEEDYIAREEIAELTVRSLGTKRPENRFYNHASRLTDHKQMPQVCGEIASQLAQGLHKAGIGQRDALKLGNFAVEFVRGAIRGSGFIRSLEQHYYQSEKNGSPFYSHFIAVHTPREEYKDAAELVDFFVKVLEYRTHQAARGVPADFRFHLELGASQHVLGNGRMYCVDKNRTVASLPFAAFQEHVVDLHKEWSLKNDQKPTFKTIREILH
jgi:hypothetical protein